MARWLAAACVWLAAAAPAASAATWRDLAVPKTSKIAGLTVSRSVPGLAWATVSGPQLLVTHDAGVSWAPFGLTSGYPTIPVEDAVPPAGGGRMTGSCSAPTTAAPHGRPCLGWPRRSTASTRGSTTPVSSNCWPIRHAAACSTALR